MASGWVGSTYMYIINASLARASLGLVVQEFGFGHGIQYGCRTGGLYAVCTQGVLQVSVDWV